MACQDALAPTGLAAGGTGIEKPVNEGFEESCLEIGFVTLYLSLPSGLDVA